MKKEASSDQNTPSLNSVLDLVGRLLALTSLATSLMFYFGWIRTNALYGYFGVDQTVLGFSTQDYLLRSISVLWELGRWILGVTLVMVWGNHLINRWLERSSGLNPKRQRNIAWFFFYTGIILILASFIAIKVKLPGPVSIPIMFYSLSWTAGICSIGYGFHLLTSSPQKKARNKTGADYSSIRRVSLGLFVALMIAGLFWIVDAYATGKGRLRARQIGYYADTPDVIIYSSTDLHLDVPGLHMDQVCDAQQVCQYRYSNLKFLVRSRDRYFLLPIHWEPDSSRVIVLPDNDSIRVEFAPGDY